MSSDGLTGDAANDLGEIFLQGILNFELMQAERYKDDLERCFAP